MIVLLDASMLTLFRNACRSQAGQLEALAARSYNLSSRHASSLNCSTSYSSCASTVPVISQANDRLDCCARTSHSNEPNV